jgi:hypothetical protein
VSCSSKLIKSKQRVMGTPNYSTGEKSWGLQLAAKVSKEDLGDWVLCLRIWHYPQVDSVRVEWSQRAPSWSLLQNWLITCWWQKIPTHLKNTEGFCVDCCSVRTEERWIVSSKSQLSKNPPALNISSFLRSFLSADPFSLLLGHKSWLLLVFGVGLDLPAGP